MKLIGTACLAGAFGIGWMVMIYGWGLVPVSWPWIIFGTLAAILVTGVGQLLMDMED